MTTDKTLVCAILVLALSSLSFQWPLDNARLTSTFGESRADHFHDGIDLVSSSETIRPAREGRLVYLWDRMIFPEENYPGGGNYVILSHGDVFSIYMHLGDGVPFRREYSPGDALGRMCNTGHSFASHLHFSLLKRAQRRSENPLLHLPAYEDRVAPQIAEFALKIDDRYVIIRENSTIRLTQHYPMLVRIIDTVSGRERLGVHSLTVSLNGVEVARTDFDGLEYSARGLGVSGGTFDELFDEDGYFRIGGVAYSQGLNVFTVSASDIAGNTAQRTFSFNVNLDMAGIN
jgi:hypothetical protein